MFHVRVGDFSSVGLVGLVGGDGGGGQVFQQGRDLCHLVLQGCDLGLLVVSFVSSRRVGPGPVGGNSCFGPPEGGVSSALIRCCNCRLIKP